MDIAAAFAAAKRIQTPPPGPYLTETERAESVRSMQCLKDEITKLAGHLNAANHRFLMLIAELDERSRVASSVAALARCQRSRGTGCR